MEVWAGQEISLGIGKSSCYERGRRWDRNTHRDTNTARNRRMNTGMDRRRSMNRTTGGERRRYRDRGRNMGMNRSARMSLIEP